MNKMKPQHEILANEHKLIWMQLFINIQARTRLKEYRCIDKEKLNKTHL